MIRMGFEINYKKNGRMILVTYKKKKKKEKKDTHVQEKNQADQYSQLGKAIRLLMTFFRAETPTPCC